MWNTVYSLAVVLWANVLCTSGRKLKFSCGTGRKVNVTLQEQHCQASTNLKQVRFTEFQNERFPHFSLPLPLSCVYSKTRGACVSRYAFFRSLSFQLVTATNSVHKVIISMRCNLEQTGGLHYSVLYS